MKQVIDTIVQRTGISPQQAEQAVQIAMNALKSRLPAPLHAQIESALSGSGDREAGPGGLGGKLGDMLRG